MKELAMCLFCIFSFCGCNGCFSKLPGTIGVTGNIAESKRREVFVCQYYAHGNFLFILNHKMMIETAWIEKHWRYATDIEKTEIEEGYQLMIRTGENEVKDYPSNFTIGVDANKYFRPCGRSSIITDFDKLPVGDSIEWFVQRNYYFSDSQPRDTIGKAILYTYPSTNDVILE